MISIIARDNGGASYEPVPAGNHYAVCYAVICIGSEVNTFNGNLQQKVMLMWELVDERMEYQGEDKARVISKTYTNSLAKNANLRKDLESWRGREFTEEEAQGFDICNILGKPCLINTTIEKNSRGYDYAKAGAVTNVPKGMKPEHAPELEIIAFDISNPECSIGDMQKLPEWIVERIRQTPEYEKRVNQQVEERAAEITEDDYAPIEASNEDLPF